MYLVSYLLFKTCVWMYYMKWVFNLKKKFDNQAILYHVNISVKFWGSFHLLNSRSWPKYSFIIAWKYMQFKWTWQLLSCTYIYWPLSVFLSCLKSLSLKTNILLFFVDLDQVAKSKKLLHFQDEIIKRYTSSILINFSVPKIYN